MTKNEKNVETVSGFVAQRLLQQLNQFTPIGAVVDSLRAVENEQKRLKQAIFAQPYSREATFEAAANVAIAAMRLMIDACL